MPPLERLFVLEIEFHSRLRQAAGVGDPSSLHTSYALHAGHEPLMRQATGATVRDVDLLAEKLALAGDGRDVLSARDSLVRLLGLKRFE